jgi:archaellum component FlaD/FlaE
VSAPYWLQDRRKPETLDRERAHLAALKWLEKLADRCGMKRRVRDETTKDR